MKERRGRSSEVLPLRGDARPQPRLVDPDLEAQVIGAVLSDNLLFRDAIFLEPEHFSDAVHAELWQTIAALALNGKAATPAAVYAALGPRAETIGGRDLISGLAHLGGMIGLALADGAERLRQLAQWRYLNAMRREIDEMMTDGSMTPDEALSALMRRAEIGIQSGRPTERRKKDVARAAVNEALEPRDLVTTGIDNLDFLMHGGLIRKRMYSIGAPTGRGKTIMVGTISENLNARSVPHLVLCLETPPEDMEVRNVARRLKLNAAQIYDQGDPLHAKFVKYAEKYIDAMPDHTIYEYMPGATMDAIHRTIIRAAHRYGIQGFMLDYWQLIRGREKGTSEVGHLDECADRLAMICRRENLWGLVTAQNDENGNLKKSDGLERSSALHIRMIRDPNDDTAHFETTKSNFTRYADTGSEVTPGMVFDLAGPHFRNIQPEDISLLSHKEEDIDLG